MYAKLRKEELGIKVFSSRSLGVPGALAVKIIFKICASPLCNEYKMLYILTRPIIICMIQ